jgi:hypothetical protein
VACGFLYIVKVLYLHIRYSILLPKMRTDGPDTTVCDLRGSGTLAENEPLEALKRNKPIVSTENSNIEAH